MKALHNLDIQKYSVNLKTFIQNIKKSGKLIYLENAIYWLLRSLKMVIQAGYLCKLMMVLSHRHTLSFQIFYTYKYISSYFNLLSPYYR